MTDENSKLPTRFIDGVEFPDYAAVSIQDWERLINRALEESDRIWNKAKDAEQINLSTTFDALEQCHSVVMNVLGPFSLLVDGGNEEAGALYEKVSGRLAQANVRQMSDPEFAQRCQQVFVFNSHEYSWPDYQRRAAEQWLLQMRLTGSLLDSDEKRDRLAELAARSAELESRFQQMNSQSCNGMVWLDKNSLDGVDVSTLEKGGDDNAEKYGVRLIREPVDMVLEKCAVRQTRQAVFDAFENRGTALDVMGVDCSEVLAELLVLRGEKARLLGFENFAQLKLAGTMAKTADAASEILTRTWAAVEPAVSQAMENIKALAREDGVADMEPWDTAFYMTRLNHNSEAAQPGATLRQTRQAMFTLAEKLFGLSFEEVEVTCPWPGMTGWMVRRGKQAVGGMLTDFTARAGKPSGAWMHLLCEGHKMGKGQLPVVANTCNFGDKGDDAVLSAMDVRTAFHEFGHALHGLLSRTNLPSQCGTNTLHDWVELPSQLLENWSMDGDCARALGLPEGAGGQTGGLTDQFQKIRYLQSAVLDMKLHTDGLGGRTLAEFEAQELGSMGADKLISPWHRLSHFSHLFSGEQYAAGYYAYLWAEALDADVFQRTKKEDPLSRESGRRLEKYIYAAGDETDPQVLFETLMGRAPDPKELIRRLGVEFKSPRSSMKV